MTSDIPDRIKVLWFLPTHGDSRDLGTSEGGRAGTRSTLAEHNLDRHWRNARTHTLHDPVRWKYSILGKYFLNGENPPLHAWS